MHDVDELFGAMVPAAQDSQLEEPVLGAFNPGEQSAQPEALSELYFPAWHGSQDAWPGFEANFPG